jgi:hypothetical protein
MRNELISLLLVKSSHPHFSHSSTKKTNIAGQCHFASKEIMALVRWKPFWSIANTLFVSCVASVMLGTSTTVHGAKHLRDYQESKKVSSNHCSLLYKNLTWF